MTTQDKGPSRKDIAPALLAKIETLLGERRTPDDAAIRWRDMDQLREALNQPRLVASGDVTTGIITPTLPSGETQWRIALGPVTTTAFTVTAIEASDLGADPANYVVSVRPRSMAVTWGGSPVAGEWVGWSASLMPTLNRDQLGGANTTGVRVLLQLFAHGRVTSIGSHTIGWAIHRV